MRSASKRSASTRATKHGPLTWQKVTRPHIEMTIMLGCGDFALASPGRNPNKKTAPVCR